MNKEDIKAIAIIILIGLLFGSVMISVLKWTEHRDKELMEWAEKYEICVANQYHTTPSAYYNENGEYPECDITISFTN